MSGHNKWSKIKHKKEATDAKKSKVFSKYAMKIAEEAKKCGGDLSSPTLKSVIEEAKKENMPTKNIERALGKASNASSQSSIVYEAYGPGGVGIIISTSTDNKNRTVAELKHLISCNGGNIAEPGSVKWAFDMKDGEYIPKTKMDLDDNTKASLEKFINAVEGHDDVDSITTNAEI